MRVEAIKVTGGFLISFEEGLQDILDEKILLEIELVAQLPEEKDYSALDQMVGLFETGDTNASVEHDRHIYRRRKPS